MRAQATQVPRRQNPSKRRRLMGRGSAVGILIVALLIGGALAFAQSDFFRLETLEIEGLDRIGSDEIQTLLDVRRGQHMFAFQLGELKARLQRDARIESALLERDFPGRLRVYINEREPLAVLIYRGLFAEVDAQGVVLSVDNRWPEGELPVLSEVDIEVLVLGEPALASSNRLLYCLEHLGGLAPMISELYHSERGITLITEEGAQIWFPEKEGKIDEAVEALKEILDIRVPTQGCTVDLRLPERPILRCGN